MPAVIEPNNVSLPADPVLLSAASIATVAGEQTLSGASGFFFARDDALFLVTSRHVVLDEPSGHRPDRLVIELHTDADDLAVSTGYSIPLYDGGEPLWRQGFDHAGEIDVAVIRIQREALPPTAVFTAFTPAHLPLRLSDIEVGSSVLVVGFPLGFHDTLHHMPVVRHAVVASSFGLRFKGAGYFLTDARTHRGSSGAPVVLRLKDPAAEHDALPWMLLGIHSASLDTGNRDQALDEALGLNVAWYADILMTLTA